MTDLAPAHPAAFAFAPVPVAPRPPRPPFRAGAVLALAGALLLGAAACSSAADVPADPLPGHDQRSAPADGGADGSTPDEVPRLDPPDPAQGLQLAMRLVVNPGEEVTLCQYIPLPDGGDIQLARLEHSYSKGSHHLVLYRSTKKPTEVPTDRFECGSAMDLASDGILYAAQVPQGQMAFPDGVALQLEAGSVVMLQTHYLNPSSAALDADVRLNLWYAQGPVNTFAGTLFFYDWAIYVPPMGQATARMRCAIPKDITLLFAMSHMHKHGVAFRSFRTGGDLAEPQPIFMTDTWADVAPRYYDPAIQLKQGEVIDFACDYRNDLDGALVDGPSAATNEMCMFVATYYPRLDPEVELCSEAGSGPVHSGDKTCAQVVDCVKEATDDVSRTQCITSTCERSSVAVGDLYGCLFRNCNDSCIKGEGGPEACTSCGAAHCLDPFVACQQATCD